MQTGLLHNGLLQAEETKKGEQKPSPFLVILFLQSLVSGYQVVNVPAFIGLLIQPIGNLVINSERHHLLTAFSLRCVRFAHTLFLYRRLLHVNQSAL